MSFGQAIDQQLQFQHSAIAGLFAMLGLQVDQRWNDWRVRQYLGPMTKRTNLATGERVYSGHRWKEVQGRTLEDCLQQLGLVKEVGPMPPL